MKDKIKYIKNILKRHNNTNVSIYTGKLLNIDIEILKQHFIIKREVFGYTNFTLLQLNNENKIKL